MRFAGNRHRTSLLAFDRSAHPSLSCLVSFLNLELVSLQTLTVDPTNECICFTLETIVDGETRYITTVGIYMGWVQELVGRNPLRASAKVGTIQRRLACGARTNGTHLSRRKTQGEGSW